jgi:hypothetical protein
VTATAGALSLTFTVVSTSEPRSSTTDVVPSTQAMLKTAVAFSYGSPGSSMFRKLTGNVWLARTVPPFRSSTV